MAGIGSMKEIAWRLVAIERQKNFGHNECMLQDGLTAAQRLAIQKLIRAKSDREIALLLRRSYHLLNPHRRRSNVSHRERWADYELRLVGRIRDEELARLLRRSPSAIAAKPGLAPRHPDFHSPSAFSVVPARDRTAWQEARCGSGPNVRPKPLRGAVEASFAGHNAVLGESPPVDGVGRLPFGINAGCRTGTEAETERVERAFPSERQHEYSFHTNSKKVDTVRAAFAWAAARC